jgi:acyl carrier protein
MENNTVDEIATALCVYIKGNIVDTALIFDAETSFSSIGIDSLSIIELVLFIERKFNVVLPEEELIPENFQSAKSLALCTYRYLNT